MALIKTQTIKELFLESILNTYRAFRARGVVMKEYKGINKKFFELIINGRCDLKLLVWKKLQDIA